MPWLHGFLPDSTAWRAGVHIGVLLYALLNRTPSVAIRSMLGVAPTIPAFPPVMPNASVRAWSAMIRRMLVKVLSDDASSSGGASALLPSDAAVLAGPLRPLQLLSATKPRATHAAAPIRLAVRPARESTARLVAVAGVAAVSWSSTLP